jgi:hypothetical protein
MAEDYPKSSCLTPLTYGFADDMDSYDTTPSILTRQIPDQRSGSEPQSKRQKGEDSNEPQTTIMARFSANLYHNLDEVVEDIDTATADIMDKLQLPNGATRNQYIPISANQSELTMKVAAFKKQAHELVRRENATREKTSIGALNGSANGTTSTSAAVGSNTYTQINASSDDSKVVLTLYGNAPGPKQLFSSLQIPTKVTGESQDILQTIREAGLPNGITTTQIIPFHSTGSVNDKKRVPTLGELFPTPATVPALVPPKPSKVATTRSSTVGWYQPSANDSLPRTASYFRQPISTGQWLNYSNGTSVLGGKRKQRDRALSLVGSKPSSLEESSETEASRLETLFRSAYSGFAPTKDDAAAVAPAGMLDKIWWQQMGEKSFSRLAENYQYLGETSSRDAVAEDETDDLDEVKRFEKLVEDIEKDPIDPSLLALGTGSETSIDEKEVEEILQGISELLETLNSYQRNRHLSLNSSSRTAGLLSTSDTTSLGTPTKPSEDEQATYEILKAQLTLMIATLPPYAVAKLDPDQLAELSISSKIEVQLNDYKGVMEEDEVASRAKVAAMSAASTSTRTAQPPVLHRPSSTALYGNQYAPSPRPNPTPAHQYYGSQTPIRPPSNSLQRPPATAPVSYAPRPVANTPYRPTSYGTPTYAHQAPRPVQQQYAPQPQQQQYIPTPAAQPYMRPAGQTYQQMPPSATAVQMNGRYPNQQSYPHQAPPQQNGMNYPYGNGANIPRQASPQKPMYSPQPGPAQTRPSYSTPTPAGPPPNRQPYLQNPTGQAPAMNGSVSHTPQPQFAPQATTNYSTFMTQAEQANLIDRQRAQMAQQQATAQQQARNAIQASMGTPSRTGPVNGTNPVAAGSN